MRRIVFEPAECDCHEGTCHYMHSPGWWVDGVSFETEKEAEAYADELNSTERQLQAGLDTLTQQQ